MTDAKLMRWAVRLFPFHWELPNGFFKGPRKAAHITIT